MPKVTISKVITVGIGSKYVQPNLICLKIDKSDEETVKALTKLEGKTIEIGKE